MRYPLQLSALLLSFGLIWVPSVWAAPTISNLTAPTTVPLYDKFEVTFQVNTSTASNVQFPFDPNPPPGVTPSVGITVDAEFSQDNFRTIIKQPAFYYQEFDYQVKSGKDWMYPTNTYSWKARFAPSKTGTWAFRVRALDQSGESVSNQSTFTVTSSSSHGFIKVSPTDSRYFEFDDGTFYPGLGYNMNFSQISWDDPIQGNTNNFTIMQQNGIQFIRMWLSQWSIFGATNSSWRSAKNNSNYEGLTIITNYPGTDFGLWLKYPDNPAMFQGWMRRPPPVKRSTNYQVSIRYLIPKPLQGPRFPSYPYGLTVKLGGWLGNANTPPSPTPSPNPYTYGFSDPCATLQPLSWGTPECYYGAGHVAASPTDASGNPQWAVLTGTFNSGAQDFMDNFYITLDNTVVPDANHGAVAVIEHVEVREDLGNGTYGPNVINKPSLDQHEYFDQFQSYAFDKVVELAKQKDVYVRPALIEKTDYILGRLAYDGTISSSYSDNNFYGDWRRETRGRWLQEAWYRYVQARWGYATSIHSWELLNEANPSNGNHYAQTDEFGKFMHCRVFGISIAATDSTKCTYDHPNDHPVSTSTWTGWPRGNFWGSSLYPNVDFADLHKYIAKNPGTDAWLDPNFYDTALSTFTLGQQYGALSLGGAGKPTLRGETGLTDTSTEPFSNDTLADTGGVWLHNFIWGQLNAGGVYDSGYWYPNTQIYYRYNNVAYDLRPQFGYFYRFIKDIPLSNGHYVEAAATSTNPNLRVWGQKDTYNGAAHLWIANPAHTWKNVVDNVSISPQSATISVPGFSSSQSYTLERWDTYTGTLTSSGNATNTNGTLSFSVTSLTTDTAVKIKSTSAPPPTLTPPIATPTPTTNPNDIDHDGDVDFVDLKLFLARSFTIFDINHFFQAF